MKFYKLLAFISLLANSLAQNDTSSSTTTTASPSSTTSSTSTATSPTTPTVGPPAPPEPIPNIPQWTVKSPNSTCILLRGNFTFAVTYTTPSGNAVSDQVDIPQTATTSGSCGPFLNSLVLTWEQGNLTFMFIKKPIYDAGVDSGSGTYSLSTIFGRLTVKNPNEPGTTPTNNVPSSPPRNGGGNGDGTAAGDQTFYISVREPGGFMTANLQNSYSCMSYQSIAADKTGSVYLQMRDIQVEAFHDGPAAEFNPSETCTQDTVSTVMSIVGYVALGALGAAAVGYFAWKKFGRAGYTQV